MIVPKTEFDQTFLDGMMDRIAVSYFKYGPLAQAAENGADFAKALETRLAMYRETGNLEWLMDVANYAMFEFMYPSHRKAHFRATDDAESPGKAPERNARRT